MKNDTIQNEVLIDENLADKLEETIPHTNDVIVPETISYDYDNENCFGEYFSAGI